MTYVQIDHALVDVVNSLWKADLATAMHLVVISILAAPTTATIVHVRSQRFLCSFLPNYFSCGVCSYRATLC